MKTRTALLVQVVSLVLIASCIFGIYKVFLVESQAKQKLEIIVYLKTSSDTVVISNDLASIKEVNKIKFVSKEEAFELFKKEMGDSANSFDVLDSNPLPDSFKVTLKPNFYKIEEYNNIVSSIKKIKNVSEVSYDAVFAQKTLSILKKIKILGASVFGALIVYAALVFIAIKQLSRNA